jgi:hypothetical protein
VKSGSWACLGSMRKAKMKAATVWSPAVLGRHPLPGNWQWCFCLRKPFQRSTSIRTRVEEQSQGRDRGAEQDTGAGAPAGGQDSRRLRACEHASGFGQLRAQLEVPDRKRRSQQRYSISLTVCC